tara:strand:+ start:11688 stop:11975 length:288 start_codon:yes stop_codon:yes gene_type:complete
MIDLNPYFQRKLGEELVFNDEHHKYLMEVISITETPNTVHLEVSSLPHAKGKYEWTYHGVFEVDLNLVQSVRSVKEAVVFCRENPSKGYKVKKLF